MTNTLAVWLIILIAGFFVLDHYYLHMNAALFLGRKFFDLLHWVAIWR